MKKNENTLFETLNIILNVFWKLLGNYIIEIL